MITFNQTPGNDNELIYLLKIELDSGNILASTAQGGIEFTGGIEYTNILQMDSISNLSANVNPMGGGGIQSIQTMSFQIIRWGDSFFVNDFYPTASANYATNRRVQFGVCWQGATDESDITWLYSGFIYSFAVVNNGIQIETFEYNELAAINLPYYTVQSDFDNGISYFTDAPEESSGLAIPFLYGDFTTVNFQYTDTHLAPAITVDKNRHTVIVCSHDVHTVVNGNYTVASTTRDYIFKYVAANNCYIAVYTNTGTSYQNNVGFHTLTVRNTGAEVAQGYSIIQLQSRGGYSDILDVSGATDKSSLTYSTLTASAGGNNRLALKCTEVIGSSSFGQPYYASGDIQINILISTAASQNFDIGYYNFNLSTPAGNVLASGLTLNNTTPTLYTYGFGNSTTAKKNGALPWGIDEVTELEFYVENNGTSPGGNPIRITNMYLELKNIVIIGLGTAKDVRGFTQSLTAPTVQTTNPPIIVRLGSVAT